MNWLLVQTSIQTLAQASVERILNALPEGILIAVFAWMLLRVLRRQNSGTRFAVWFIALLAVAALPVLGGFSEGRATLVAGMAPGVWGSMQPAIHIPAQWAIVVFLIWAVGAGVAMARLAAGLWRLRSLRNSCTPIVVRDLAPAVQETVKAISKSATIATSDCVRVPAAVGLWKRTIVLPTWALRELPADDLNAILLHEFEHLRRGDDWTNLIQRVVGALFFFHPAVWWIEARLSVEREMACDDAVLSQTANPHGYATCLVSLLEKSLAHRVAKHPSDKRWSLAQAVIHRAREATLRLAQILDTNRPKSTRVWKPALGVVGVFATLCVIALPNTPQIVAFDRGPLDSGDAYSARLSHGSLASESSLPPTAVIPAAWRTDESSSAAPKMAAPKISHEHVNTGDVAHRQSTPTSALRDRANAASPSEKMIAISANADQAIVPQFQTLIFVEATQYGPADSSVWQVQVWRVTLVNAIQPRLIKVPVFDSI
jgi:beta-lactamase regulating signal transducer with metallopeptidase domain